MIPTFQSLRPVVEGNICLLELNHGKANEMGRAEVADFEQLCHWLESMPVRALITFSRRTSGKGTPLFISGANVTERTDWETAQVKAHVRHQRNVLARLRRVPVFHVAVVHGLALGWGTEFLLSCDWRVACPGAAFGLPETGLGILPGAGGTAELAALIGMSQALRLGMTGERIDATEAVRIGLCDELATDLDAGLGRARALAALVAQRSPTAVAAFKAAALNAVGLSGNDRSALEASAYEHCVDTGEAAIGRASFATIAQGGRAEWGPYKRWAF